ncbi:MAG: natA 3 [Planctomycetota bacterium]|nr:natA 3 [Planctomycetota bacterium]
MDAISIQHVTKSYGKHVAVNALSLHVPRGSLYGFIGPNGSGKTTTLRMIMNILLPDSGEIVVLGQTDTRTARDRISYLPEERGLYKKMTVRRLLRYYGQLKGMKQPALDASIRSWIDRMELSDWLDKKVDALSKGMAQKVQFIAAAVAAPELLILDEPFSGLDPVNAEILKEAVLDLRKNGTTVVFSTHDMGMAEKLCDRIFMIFKGTKVLDGTLDEIQESFGSDTVRVRTADGMAALDGLSGVEFVNDSGNVQDVRWNGDPQDLLRALLNRTEVHHFEITRPSLHDIFVRIAHPEPEAVSRG